MKDILVFVASKFEDTELITAINIFDRNNLTFDLVSIEDLNEVKANRFATIKTLKMSGQNLDNYKAIYLPGGPGHKQLAKNPKVLEVVKKYANQQKLIAAICGAPLVLDKANLLTNKKATAFGPEYIPHASYVNQPIAHVTDHILTGRDYLATPDLAFALIKLLKK